MSASTAVATDFSYTRLLEGAHKPRKLSKAALFAVSVSVAAHVGVGVYLATQKFIMPIIEQPKIPLDVTTIFEPKKRLPEPVKLRTPPPPPPAQPTHQVEDPVETKVTPLPVPPVEGDKPSEQTLPPASLTGIADAKPTQVASLDPRPVSPPAPKVIRSPNWLSRPSPAQLGRLYPERAAEMGITGGATLLCEVTLAGTMRNCAVVDESPKGRGFGAAALESSKLFKMSPKTVDGESVEGARVRIPLSFTLG